MTHFAILDGTHQSHQDVDRLGLLQSRSYARFTLFSNNPNASCFAV